MNKIEEKCCMYTDIIEAMGRDSLLEPERAKLHSEICNLLEIPHDSTKHITGDLTGVSGRQLYSKLLKLKEDLEIKDKKQIFLEQLRDFREVWGKTSSHTKEASVQIYNKLIHMKCTCPEEIIYHVEAHILEAGMRHKAVFGSEITLDCIIFDNINRSKNYD